MINEVQHGLAQNLDMQAMYQLVGERIREIFHAQVVDIGVLNPSTGLLDQPYASEKGVRIDLEPAAPSPVTQHVMHGTEPVLLNDDIADRVAALGGSGSWGDGHDEMPRAWLLMPLIVGGEAIGRISLQNMDDEDAFGEDDARLLATIARSLSIALENARLFEETRQRNAELALINDVQRGLAEKLEMQAMYDLVGDRIRDIFDAQVVDIGIVDRDADLIRFPYAIERGERFPDEPLEIIGFRKQALETRAPIVVNENVAERAAKAGQPIAIQGEPPLSDVFVPLIVAGQATGVISLQNLDRENAFSENDVRLLTTLAGSLSVALENARLFEETGRRAAELAIVNNVGQAIAQQLDLEALIDSLGDELVKVFSADLAYVALHDRETDTIQFLYFSEDGDRRDNPPMRFGEGLTSKILQTREPLLLNRASAFEEVGVTMVGTPGSPTSASRSTRAPTRSGS